MFDKVEMMRRQTEQIEADAAAARVSAAEQNRRRMPVLSAFIESAKAALGDGLKVTYASENGTELGKKDTSDGVKLSETHVGHYVRQKK
jgi:hypothetical protein